MKTKLFYSVILIIISFVSFGQRNIVLSSYPKKVPENLITKKMDIGTTNWGRDADRS
jgi:hypothetical protein